MRKLIAVTGATGFIGSALVRALSSAGWSVRVLVRSPARAKSLPLTAVEQIPGSLEDPGCLDRLVRGVSAVAHCAGAVRGATQAQFDVVNAQGLANLLEAVAALDRPPRFLALSSLAAREPALSAYAASKRKGEEILARNARGMAWAALRPPAVYGPGDRELLPLFRLMGRGIAPVLGSRDGRFSMLHVDDLVSAILCWLQHERANAGIYELHDGCVGGYSWGDVIDTASGLCGRRVRALPIPPALLRVPALVNWLAGRWFPYSPMLTPGKLRELRHPDWVCDNQAIHQATGWKPTIALREGLERLPGWAGYQGRA